MKCKFNSKETYFSELSKRIAEIILLNTNQLIEFICINQTERDKYIKLVIYSLVYWFCNSFSFNTIIYLIIDTRIPKVSIFNLFVG